MSCSYVGLCSGPEGIEQIVHGVLLVLSEDAGLRVCGEDWHELRCGRRNESGQCENGH